MIKSKANHYNVFMRLNKQCMENKVLHEEAEQYYNVDYNVFSEKHWLDKYLSFTLVRV